MNVERAPKKKRGAAVIALLLSTVAAPLNAQSLEEASNASLEQRAAKDEGGLGTIVVTARRKEETLQDTPISLTAFD